MQSKPNYKEYSLDELYDAQRNVDSSRYPDRAARIAAEITNRRESSEESPQVVRPPTATPRNLGLGRRTLATYLVVSGIISLGSTLDVARSSGGAFAVVAFGVMTLAYGGMILAGVSLWAKWVGGMFGGSVALLIQIPFVQVGRVAYTVSATPSLELNVWPRAGFSFSSGSAFTIFLHETSQEFYLGVNVLACLLCWALVHFGIRRRAAASRLKRAETAG